MHHYPHHLGDYTKDTMHLSPLEHGVYRLLMDAYYATEKPIPLDFASACRIARCVSKDEQEALQRVLDSFFTPTADGYRQKRIDLEIESYQERAQIARDNGRRGGRPASTEKPSGIPDGIPSRIPDGVPAENPAAKLTSNQEPITNKKTKAHRLPDGFAVSPQLREWAQAEGFSNLEAHLAYFRDWAIGSGALKTNWDATFRNAVRGNWAKLPAAGPKSADPPWKGAK
jgi:uncharacterized protein YdaU (DUF1376 family)